MNDKEKFSKEIMGMDNSISLSRLAVFVVLTVGGILLFNHRSKLVCTY